MRKLRQFLNDESGPTAVEYAVMLAMIILVAISGIGAFGQANNNKWQYVKTELENHP